MISVHRIRRVSIASSCVFSAALCVTSSARAQGVGDEFALPGATVASVSGAESPRVNPAALAMGRTSTRLVHLDDLSAANTFRHADTLTWTTGLPLGFGLSLGASWVRPVVRDTATGAYATGELGLAYALDRRLSVGVRRRLFASGGGVVENTSSLDLGALWRPNPWLAFGAVARHAVGPQSPAQGLDRTVAGGVALRPIGTDAFTLGADVIVPWSGPVTTRAGARLAIPRVGYLRAEGVYDFDTNAWRAGAGLEFYWGRWSAGGAGFYGSEEQAGYVASLGYDGERSPVTLPERDLVVTVPLESAPSPRAFGRLLWRLERLRRDREVRGILFAPRAEVGGLAHAEELREMFVRLRRAGVRVACHLTEATASTWYACAGVDRVTVDAAGGVRLAGLRTSHYYLGPALWNLGVRTDFVRIGDWKSAPEQFTREGSTGAARAQEELLLDDYFATFAQGVAASRHLSDADARAAITGGPYTARDARQRGLIDGVQSLESAERGFALAVGGAARVDLDDYVAVRGRRWASNRTVAVIYIDGDISEGENSDIPVVDIHRVGDRSIVEALEVATADARVGAIVLRVDSPGGSALASDLIWRAVVAANRRKPVIASFGRVAASGGYYVAAGAREIYADPSCLTGSIGIFYGKADVAPLLTRLEVGVEFSRRGERADMESLFRPYTPEERRFLADKIGEFYGLFLQRVATGRRRTQAEVDAVGEGRVWSGTRARELGLVDRTGGLMAAVERARELADLPEDHELTELPAEGGGILRTIARMVTTEPSSPPSLLSLVLSSSEVRTPIVWLLSVSSMSGTPVAMTDWPVVTP